MTGDMGSVREDKLQEQIQTGVHTQSPNKSRKFKQQFETEK